MNIKDQLEESDCGLCHAARTEIIRLEAEIINKQRWLDRLSKHRDPLNGRIPKTALGRALAKIHAPGAAGFRFRF